MKINITNVRKIFFLQLLLFSFFSPELTSAPLGGKEVSPVREIQGTVTDAATKQALPGVSVVLKGTTTGTVTDVNGLYRIRVPDNGSPVLIFSFIGYATLEYPLAGAGTIDVALMPQAGSLNEVVVIGYGTQRRRDLTGAIGSVTGKQLGEVPLTSFDNALQGRIAGVQVQEPSGEPGAAPVIRVRGVGSISGGNEPLYVIDGFPANKNVDLGQQGDISRRTVAFALPPANPLATLNPGDIESIEVLKDASAAAIYGSRGSNGVILITTKKGKRNTGPTVSFDAYTGIQEVARKVRLMNAAQLSEYVREAKDNAYVQDVAGALATDDNAIRYQKTTNTAYYLPDDFINPDGTDTDWQDLIFRKAPVQSYSASVSGGSDRIGYFFSGGYFNQRGIVRKSGFERYSFRVNLEADITPKVKAGLGLSPSFTSADRPPANAPYFADPPGIVYSALVTSPTVKPYLPDGSINQTDNQSHLLTPEGKGASMTEASNPLAIIKNVTDRFNQFRTLGNLYLTYEPVSGLRYKFYAGADVNTLNRSFYRAKELLFRQATTGDPYGQSNAGLNVNWLLENTLSYEKSFGGHYIAALAGYSAQKDRNRLNQVYAQNYSDDLVPTISGGQVTSGNEILEEWSLASYLFRVNYAFKEKYLAGLSFRADRSSRFGEGNKTGYFPSLSAGWRISEENFLKENRVISDLKIRGSWGLTGNFQIPNYAAIGLLNPSNYVIGNILVNGIAPYTAGNRNLTWEKTRQLNFGIDFGIFSQRVQLSADWYRKNTTDLLLYVQLPAAVGFTSTLQNIGEVENKGVELTVVTRNLTGAFTWDSEINFSRNRNKVLRLGPGGEPILSSGGAGIRHITRVGDAIGSYYGYVVEGIYQSAAEIAEAPKDALAPKPQPGDFRFRDVNGDGRITADDRTVTGNYQPDFTWGFTNRFGYRRFDLNLFFQGVQGSRILNLTRRHLGNGEAATNSYADWTERWRSPEQPGNGKIPRADRLSDAHGGNNRPSSYQVEDGSYIRLRSVSLGYTFAPAGLNGRFRSLRAYLTATNLFTGTRYIGYNPEVNNQATQNNVQGEDYGAYPLAKSYMIGINATF